jgi:hypothetical protein
MFSGLSFIRSTKLRAEYLITSCWQPLTELAEKKCKRCGLYDDDFFKDHVFDEWEMCSTEFKDGKYTHFKEGQFNATFLCPNCTGSAGTALIQYLLFQLVKKIV